MKGDARGKGPNLLLFITDDQRFDTLGCLNNPEIRTPNLDYLVRNGTTFTNAHIMGGSHEAVCMPSRAMMHTGRTLFHLQEQGQEVPAEHTLLGEHLGANGYARFGTGKWHNGTSSFARSFSDGGQIFFGGMDDHWNVPLCNYAKGGAYPAPRRQPWNPGTGKIEEIDKVFDHVVPGRHSTDLFADAASEFLRNPPDSPFFCYVAFMAPHDPRTMPQQYLTMYDPSAIRLPSSYLDAHPFDNGEMEVRDERLAGRPRRPDEIRRHIAEYYAMITHLDAAVGRVLDALKASGRFDETIIVHTADHGLALGRHGLMGKQNNYEHGIHIPLIMAGPGIGRGQLRDGLCYNIDLYPTICDLLELPTPSSVEGKSLAPSLADGTAVVRDSLLHAYRDVQRSARDRRYKLIEYVVGSGRRTQLFDLQNDPDEINDIAGAPENAPVVARLRLELAKWRSELDDPSDLFWRGMERG